MVSYEDLIHPIDSSLVSKFLPLTDLVDVRISAGCPLQSCVSRFTDEDVERLAIALPKLEVLTLGERPCKANTCPTTILSLLSLSIHCTKLRYLNIHFSTRNIWVDMLDTFCDAYSHGLHLRPKSGLKTLVVQDTPLDIDYSGHTPAFVSMGMVMIFPSLNKFVSETSAWDRLEFVVKNFGLDPELPVLTEKLVKLLYEMKVQAEENPGAPPGSFVCPCLSFDARGRVH